MIDQLNLTNFQSHGDTQLVLHPGVNAIIGPSDVGKSALLRGLRWVFENQPSGNAFLRHGEKEVSVSLGIDGATVNRSKSKAANKYVHNGEIFKAMGKGKVPAEIEALLNINPDVNGQWQHDTPFMLGDGWTAGQVAATLNKAVNLEVIDSAMYRTTSMQLKTTQAKNVHTTELTRAQAALAELVGLDELDGQVAALEETRNMLKGKITERGSLKAYLRDINQTTFDLGCLPQIPEGAGQQAASLVADVARHGVLVEGHRALGRVLHDVGAVGVQLEDMQWVVPLDLKHVEVLGAVQESDTKQDVYNELQTLLTAVKINGSKLVDTGMALAAAQEQFASLMPDECPLCGAEVE